MKNQILDILKFKQPKYILNGWITKNYPELYLNILKATKFLPEDAKIQQRIYCVLNDINESQTCLNCKKEINYWHQFNISKEEYLKQFCSNICAKSYKIDINAPIENKCFNLEQLKEKISLIFVATLKQDKEFVDQMKAYFVSLGIDYGRMQLVEMINFIKWDLKELPKCQNENCNNTTRYHNGHYEDFCCLQCHLTSQRTKDKRIETVQKIYGVNNVFELQETKDKIKEMNLVKYGEEHYQRTQRYKNFRHNKPAIVNLEKYRKSRYLNTYKDFSRFANIVLPNFSELEYHGGGYKNIYNWKCVKCNCNFDHWYHNGMVPSCPVCNKGTKIESYLSDFLSNRLGLSIQTRCRSILKDNKELDIYVKDIKIAIEINGNYWHSEMNGITKDYHLNKTNECLSQDIRLVHIFEDEFTYKRNVVLAKLIDIFYKNRYKIDMDKCEVREINDKKFEEKFINKYCLEDWFSSNLCLGVFYKNRVIGMISFVKRDGGGWEISRVGVIRNFSFKDVYQKILNYFEENYEWKFLVMFLDLRWEDPKDYFRTNFLISHQEDPRYWLINDYHGKRLYAESFVESWEELNYLGFDRIWDVGNFVMIKENKH